MKTVTKYSKFAWGTIYTYLQFGDRNMIKYYLIYKYIRQFFEN